MIEELLPFAAGVLACLFVLRRDLVVHVILPYALALPIGLAGFVGYLALMAWIHVFARALMSPLGLPAVLFSIPVTVLGLSALQLGSIALGRWSATRIIGADKRDGRGDEWEMLIIMATASLPILAFFAICWLVGVSPFAPFARGALR